MGDDLESSFDGKIWYLEIFFVNSMRVKLFSYQLVGLILEFEFAKLDFGLESKHYSGVFLVPIAVFIENATIGYLQWRF